MPRKLRVEFPWAIYHGMSRGDRREDSFRDDVDRQDFLKTLAEGQHYGLTPGLTRVSAGEEITITRHEKPVARLVPIEKPGRMEWATLFARMADFRTAYPLIPRASKRSPIETSSRAGRKR